MPALPADVDVEAAVFGGQAFTWWREEDRIEGVARGTRVTIEPSTGRWRSTPERDPGFLARYLGAQRAGPALLAEDPVLGDLACQMPGLRLLDQDPWEAFLAFLISPANSVPRIQATIARLCHELGPVVGGTHTVPSPRTVAEAGEKRLRELGLGFRAPRVQSGAEEIASGRLDLDGLTERPIEEAHQRLVELDGVGPKVAECVLCYALSFDDAFPVDRWVARTSQELIGEELTPQQARKRWGEAAAIAQQVLFHGARQGLVEGIDASPVAGFDAWRGLAAPENPT